MPTNLPGPTDPLDIALVEAKVEELLRHTADLPPAGREALMAILDYFQSNLDRAIARANRSKPDKSLAKAVRAATGELAEAARETARAADEISIAANNVEQLSHRAEGSLAGDLARASSRISKVKGTLAQVDALFSDTGTRPPPRRRRSQRSC